MATEKILNTRIQLKYDTLANWNASSFKLKAGELAIVSLGEMKDGSTGLAAQYPVLFKVGTGNHTFAELPFASALAADVFAWAKAKEVKLTGKELQFVDGADSVVKSVTLNFITENEAKGFISDALKAYSTTEQMNAAIKVEADRADAAEKALGQRIDAIVTGDNSIDSKVNAAIAALDSNATQAAGADGLALSVSIVDGKLTAISGSIAAETYDAHGAAAAAQSAAEGKVTELENKLGTAAYAATTDFDAAGSASAAEGRAATDATNKANKALEDAKAYADDVKKAILTGDSTEEIKEAYDTLIEIQKWIEGDGVNATELTEAIAAEAKTRGEEDTKLQNQIDALGITDGKVSNAATADVANSLSEAAKAEVKAVKVDNATAADVAAKASGLDDSGVAAVKAVKVDNATNADNAINLGGVAAGDYALKTDAQGYANTAESNAKGYADSLAGNYATAAQGGKADTALQSVEVGTGLKVSDKAENKQTIEIDNTVVFVFNCGSATTLID